MGVKTVAVIATVIRHYTMNNDTKFHRSKSHIFMFCIGRVIKQLITVY